MQTKVTVGKEDNGKIIRLGVGDMLEVSLPETTARAAWRVEVEADVLAPVSSPTNTQTVWVLDDADQRHLRTFRAARQGRTQLKMTYGQIEGGAVLDTFNVVVEIGNPPKPKLARQQVPVPQLLMILARAFIGAAAAAFISFRLVVVASAVLQGQTEAGRMQANVLLGILGVVAFGTVTGYVLMRIVGIFASRLR